MSFRDRSYAGRALAAALIKFKGEPCVVLALPRGGVPVAAEVAKALHAPLDLILVRKIGVPIQPELAMGAVVDGDEPLIVRNDEIIREAGIEEYEFKEACDRELLEIGRRRNTYLAGRRPIEITGRTAIVIDDGIATGATTRAALRATRKRNPEKLVLAIPVAPSDTVAELRGEADEIICLETYANFGAIGYYYADFSQVPDQDVIDFLAASRLLASQSVSASSSTAPQASSGLRS